MFYGLSRCQIWPSKGSMSRYTNMTVFTVKLKGTAERIPSIILKRVQNVINYLSNERVCMKFGRLFAEILKSKFRCGVHTEIYGVFKVKNRKKFQSGSAKCHWTWKWASLTRRTDAKWLYPTKLDANWNTLTGLYFGVLSPTAIQILYSLFTSKPKRTKLANKCRFI